MGSTINLSWSELMDQAASTADFYLGRAVKAIDNEFGKGYAVKNPALVAELMKVSAMDYNNATLAVLVQKEVTPALQVIADAIAGKTK